MPHSCRAKSGAGTVIIWAVQTYVDRGGDITTEMVVEALLSNPLLNTMVALVDFDTARLAGLAKEWETRR